MIDAIKRVGLVLNPNEPIRFLFDENGLTLEAGKGDESQATEYVGANLNGDNINVALIKRVIYLKVSNVLETPL